MDAADLEGGSAAETSRPRASFSVRRSVLYGVGNFGAGMVFAFTNAALPLYLASYGLPNWANGLLAQDRPPLAGLSQIAVGFLSDRTRTPLGRRRPYILFGIPLAAATLAAGTVGPLTTTVLIAGDDADAKSDLAGVFISGGLEVIDAGSLKRARELEAIGFLQLTLAVNEKVSWTGGFGIAA